MSGREVNYIRGRVKAAIARKLRSPQRRVYCRKFIQQLAAKRQAARRQASSPCLEAFGISESLNLKEVEGQQYLEGKPSLR